MDSLRSVHGVIYVIFYRRIQIPRISGNFGACADSVYQLSFLLMKESLGSRLARVVIEASVRCVTTTTAFVNYPEPRMAEWSPFVYLSILSTF